MKTKTFPFRSRVTLLRKLAVLTAIVSYMSLGLYVFARRDYDISAFISSALSNRGAFTLSAAANGVKNAMGFASRSTTLFELFRDASANVIRFDKSSPVPIQ
jgi:hypothetical protein